MIFLTSKVLSAYDFGVAGLMFIIITALIRVVVYMIKKDREKGCKVFGTGKCPIADEWKLHQDELLKISLMWPSLSDQVSQLYDIHLGSRAVGPDGIPRWYHPHDLQDKINNLYAMVYTIKDGLVSLPKQQVSKESTDIHKSLKGLIETIINEKKKEI